jgi:hypothetical protein
LQHWGNVITELDLNSMVHFTIARLPHHQHIRHSNCVTKEMKLAIIGTRDLRWLCHVFLEEIIEKKS